MAKLLLLAGLLVLIALLAAVPRRVPSTVIDRSESVTSSPQHTYLHLHPDDDLLASRDRPLERLPLPAALVDHGPAIRRIQTLKGRGFVFVRHSFSIGVMKNPAEIIPKCFRRGLLIWANWLVFWASKYGNAPHRTPHV